MVESGTLEMCQSVTMREKAPLPPHSGGAKIAMSEMPDSPIHLDIRWK